MGQWGPPLRIARRTTRRALGRTILVAALIGLPVFGATLIGTISRTADASGENLATRALGSADASIAVSPFRTLGEPLFEPFLQMGEQGPPDGAEEPVRDPETFDPSPLLPPGTKLARALQEVGNVEIRGPQTNSTIRVIAGDGQSPLAKGTYKLDSGRYPGQADEVAISPTLAKSQDLLDGDKLRSGATLTTGDDQKVAVVGLARTLDEPRVRTVFTTPNSPLVSTPSSAFTRHLADLPASVDPATLVRPLNGKGLVVLPRANVVDPPPSPYGTSGQASAIAMTALIIGFGVLEIVLLAGTAFAVGARRQTRELGLITATGGTPRDVRRVVLAQGLFAGLVGAGGGVVLALGFSFAGKLLWERLTATLFTSWQVPWTLIALVGALGLLAGLAAAVVPAIGAGRQAPLAALAGRFATTTGSARIRAGQVLLLIGGIVCVVAGSGAIAVAFEEAKRTNTDELARTTVTPTGPITLVLLGITTVIAALVWMLPTLVAKAAVLARVLPLSGRLAVRDAARHRHRTGPAAAAIMMAVAATAAMAFAISNLTAADAEEYTPDAHDGDAVLRFDTGGPDALSYSPELVRRTAGLLAVKADYSLSYVSRFGAQKSGDYLPLLSARPEGGGQAGNAVLVAVDPSYVARFDGWGARAAAELRAGRILVPFANQARNGEATLVEDLGTQNPAVTRHPATYLPGTPNVGQFATSALVSPAEAAKLGTTKVFQTHFQLTREPTDDELAGVARLLGHDDALTVERGYQNPAAYWLAGLLGAATIVTLLGVAISVSLSAAEGRADLATLAAVGAPPRRRRNLAAAQAWVLGQIGCLLGVGVGSLFGYVVHAAYGSPYFAVPWAALGGIVLVVPLFAGLLAWLTTRSRLPMVSRLG